MADFVKLKPKDKKAKVSERYFLVSHANEILKKPNSQWELNDPGYKWNGVELAKNTKKTSTSEKTE